MGNASSSHHPSSSKAETNVNDAGSSGVTSNDDIGGNVVRSAAGEKSGPGSAPPPGASPSKQGVASKIIGSDGRISGRFNPHVTIQTLGSGSGAVEDATSGYYYGGMMYNLENNNNSTVGNTFGAALGGVAGAVAGNSAAPGDVLFSSIQKDLNVSAVGGQLVGMSRLWPGSGRMMRSYRIRVRVPRSDSRFSQKSGPSPAPDSGNNQIASASPFTVELACKSFIVRSEKGESPLRTTLTEGDAELKRLRSTLSDPSIHPHILPYARWIVGPSSSLNPSVTTGPVARPIYLLRQHVHASLSDRLASRPFLTLIEKNWITYQLLNALQSLHDAGVCHGHLTTENVLLTSWNWVLLTDVGCQHFKPVALPDDDPGLWIHWFEGRGGEFAGGTSGIGPKEKVGGGHHSGNGEKRCTLAPERFFTPGQKADTTNSIPTTLSPAMDVFSLGCVLIELFLNGERALDLGDLMEYKRQDDASNLPQSLKQKLDKIESSKMRAACRHMLSLHPSARLSPVEYLERLSSNSSSVKKSSLGTGKETKAKSLQYSTHAPIPACFKSTISPLMLRLRTEILSPDARIALVACHYGDVLRATVGIEDPWGVNYFSRLIGPTLQRLFDPTTYESPKKMQAVVENSESPSNISGFSLNELLLETESLLRQIDSGWAVKDAEQEIVSSGDALSLPKPSALVDNIPQSPFNELGSNPTPTQLSMIIFLQVVFSSVRHVQRTSSKFVALKLMHRIALFSPDEVRLQRIVPFVTSLLQDPEPIIRANAIHVLASVLSTVTSFPPSDAQLFPQYVFKKVAHLITDASLIVRVAFAENIALLAETSLRFLDVGHSVSLYEAVVGRHSRDGSSQDSSISDADSKGETPESVTTVVKSSYESDLAALHEVVLRWMIHITTDTSEHSSQSKQALLSGLPRLCSFFGGEYSFQILPQILAFLNDRKDWQLRAALCRNLPSVCVAVGRAATEQFVIPCIETALNDDEEPVIVEAIDCLSTLISLSLLTRTSLLGTDFTGTQGKDTIKSPGRSRRRKEGTVRKCTPLLRHRSLAVRSSSARLVLRTWQVLDAIDAEVFINQLLRPYLRYRPVLNSSTPVSHLFACLEPPFGHKAVSDNAVDRSRQLITNQILSQQPEVEVLLKLARALSIPSQRAVELVSPCVPKWFESLLLAEECDADLGRALFSLGFASLQKVYGISVAPSANLTYRSFVNCTDSNDFSSRVKHGDEIDERTTSRILSRPEVKVAESACKGEWGSSAVIDDIVPENVLVTNKIHALNAPPLPPSLGLAMTKTYDRSGFDADASMKNYWVPKEDNLVGTTSLASGHAASVVRLAVSNDNSFFVSASHDGKSKVYELRRANYTGGELECSLTYEGHASRSEFTSKTRVNDVAILENSHSVATAASDGSLHVWKVDMVSPIQTQSSTHSRVSSVSGLGTIREVIHDEGEVLAVSQFNTSSSSILAYATQRGSIHSLDLRSSRQPFALNLSPDLGYMTDMQVGDDHNWIVAGTSRGFLALWDVRYQTMVKLWQHGKNSPVKRLANASLSYSSNGKRAVNEASRPLVFMGSVKNEASLFDISTGDCLQSYRILDPSLSFVDQSALPIEYRSAPHLESIAIPNPRSKRQVSLSRALAMCGDRSQNYDCVNALVGCISRDGPSYLLTGGSDRMIRYWDLNSASKCFTLSGMARGQQAPSFEQIESSGITQLFVCRQPSTPSLRLTESSKLPTRNKQGALRCDNRHNDAILDIKLIESPMMGVLSSSRDGTIKLWA